MSNDEVVVDTGEQIRAEAAALVAEGQARHKQFREDAFANKNPLVDPAEMAILEADSHAVNMAHDYQEIVDNSKDMDQRIEAKIALNKLEMLAQERGLRLTAQVINNAKPVIGRKP